MKFDKLYQEFKQARDNFSYKIAIAKLIDKLARKVVRIKLLAPIAKYLFECKHWIITTFLENNFKEFIQNYRLNRTPISREQKYIFSFWMQGLKQAPELVKTTIESQKKYAEKYGYQFVFLDRTNVSEYVELPEEITYKIEKGIISPIHYSDFLRMALLSQYNAIWFDSTIYISSKQKLTYLDDFYTVKVKEDQIMPRFISRGRWAMYCLSGVAHNEVYRFLRDFQIEYFRCYDHPLDYVLIDYLMEVGYRNIPELQQIIDNIPNVNSHIYFLAENLSHSFDQVVWQQISQDTKIFKTTYKIPIQENSNSYFTKMQHQEL